MDILVFWVVRASSLKKLLVGFIFECNFSNFSNFFILHGLVYLLDKSCHWVECILIPSKTYEYLAFPSILYLLLLNNFFEDKN